MSKKTAVPSRRIRRAGVSRGAAFGALLLLPLGLGAQEHYDSLRQYNLDDLRQQVAAEKQRQDLIRAELAKEQELLSQVKDAVEQLRRHYNTIKALRRENLTVTILDNEAARTFEQTVQNIKTAQKEIVRAATVKDIEKALAATQGQIGILKNTLDQKRHREQEIIQAASHEDLTKIRSRALVMMNEIKNDLAKNITAVSTGGGMKIQHATNLRTQIGQIDAGIREIEKATTSEKVGSALGRIHFDGEQLKLLDSKLHLQGKRGTELAQAVAGRDVATVRTTSLTLMKIIKRDLDEQIRARTTSTKMKIHSLNELKAQLRIVNDGIREVEKAASSDNITQVLATVQHDLGDIGTLVTRKKQLPEKTAEPVTETQPIPAATGGFAPATLQGPARPTTTGAGPEPDRLERPSQVRLDDRESDALYHSHLWVAGLGLLNLLINIYLLGLKWKKNH